MKKILLSIVAVAGLALISVAPAKAELVVSTASTVGVQAKAVQSNGTIVEACIVSASTTNINSFLFYDGSTLKFVISVLAGTSFTINFKELLKEEWLLSGAFNVKAKTSDAEAQATCSVYQKRGN